MNLHISKSKNAESFYICKSYVKANGSTSSMIVRKLGTLEQLLIEHGPTRDDVLAWAKNEVKIETEKYKKENEENKYVFEKSAARQNDRGRICGSDSVRDACAASSHIGKGWCRGHSDRCTVYLYKCSVRDRADRD